jgi:hypothetical protein
MVKAEKDIIEEIIEEYKRKHLISTYVNTDTNFCCYDDGYWDIEEILNKVLQSQKQKMIEEIENLPNPYPLDIFPKLELSEFQTQTINDFLASNLRFHFDRLSAELMRRARENCKLDILKVIGEENGN